MATSGAVICLEYTSPALAKNSRMALLEESNCFEVCVRKGISCKFLSIASSFPWLRFAVKPVVQKSVGFLRTAPRFIKPPTGRQLFRRAIQIILNGPMRLLLMEFADPHQVVQRC